MKNIIFITLIVTLLASCVHTYNTKTGSKDNVSYIVVLKESGQYNDVSIIVDDQSYKYGKVYKIKAKRKAPKIEITPGKHHLKVLINGKMFIEEDIYIGLQETKTITLK